MDKFVKDVISRYMGGPNEKAPEYDETWMEHLKNKAKATPVAPEIVIDMLKKKKLTKPFSIYNPYDYTSPSDKPKSVENAPPFTSKIPPEIDYGLFNSPPNLFGEQGALEDWYKSRRRDWTSDPSEQNPAISLVRRHAREVVAQHRLRHYPLIVPECEFDYLGSQAKIAASLDEILSTDHHYKNNEKINRATACTAVWQNQNNTKDKEKGFFVFRVNCPPSSDTHTVYVQFLRGDQEKGYTSYAQYPVQIACTCLSFLYYGAQYYAVQGKYMYMPAFRPSLLPPKLQSEYVIHRSLAYPKGKRHPGRGVNFRVCKHILAVYDQIKRFRIEKYYKEYPEIGPPSEIRSAKAWKDTMKFDFNEASIKQRLRSPRPKIPAFFRREEITQSVIDWFNNVWIPRTDDQKIKALRDMVEFPERIFFILMKEAYLKRSRGEKISDRLINEGYDLMSKVIQPENKEEPETAPGLDLTEEQKEFNISPPGGEQPADKFIKQTPGVEPAIKKKYYGKPKEPVSKEKQREIAKKLRGVKKSD